MVNGVFKQGIFKLSHIIFFGIVFGTCGVTAAAYANTGVPSFYSTHAVGWFWDQATPKEVTQKALNPIKPAAAMALINTIPDPIQRLQAMQHLLTEAKDTAVLQPTMAHITTFLALQNAVSTKATLLRQNWQALLLNNPALNFNVNHPTSEWANNAALQTEQSNTTNAIRQFAKHYGLFFFYRSTCPHCQHFAPVVHLFAAEYGFAVVPVTLDGNALPEFPNSVRDGGQATRLNVQEVPSLFAVNPDTHEVIALGAGDRAMDQLQNDVMTAIHYEAEKQNGGAQHAL